MAISWKKEVSITCYPNSETDLTTDLWIFCYLNELETVTKLPSSTRL